MNIDPREWDQQERALREDPAWREVAQALRRSPGEPPADFAASVAALVADATPARAAVAHEAGIERWLLRALGVVLAASCVYALARWGRAWFGGLVDGFDAIVPALGGQTALNWVLAAGACMLLSWAFAQGGPRLRPSRR